MRASAFLAGLGAAVAAPAALAATQPPLPLSSTSRWIVDAEGSRVKLTCVNWAGHLEANLPEGLNKKSVEYIADQVAGNGFNCVRLTYSIDHALAPNVTVEDSFTNAAAAAGVNATTMQAMYPAVVQNNPWAANATQQDAYAKVISTLWDRGVMTILDNHVSRAQWCCNLTDGNGWWDEGFGYNALNSRYFNTQNWLDGLEAIATFAGTQTGVVGMSLRNEVRQLLLQGTLGGSDDWYTFMGQGAARVHGANADLLILIGGTESATDLTQLRGASGLGNLDWSGWAGKHVWEWHAYQFTVTFALAGGDCNLAQDAYGLFDGFVLAQNETYTAPLVLTEFGFAMNSSDASPDSADQGLTSDDYAYFTCLRDYLEGNDADWALWTLEGSYYVREGVIDHDEGYGLLSHDWDELRNPNVTALLAPMFNATQGP
ncbi:glycoside hydrolase family 5 protein [Xylariaceae sp. FL0804]|nr:glycoside hydrolase family 5 protein [Xylariaceae sp. FL0804]